MSSMPFDKYLSEHDQLNYQQNSNTLQFQLPNFIYNGPPTLAPGGGAEVLPPGLLSTQQNSNWFQNSGFNPEPFSSKQYGNLSDDENQSNAYEPAVPSTSADELAQFNDPLQANLLALSTRANLNAPSPVGLPVYSSSGFDLISILARVVTRPHPKIVLGPVDMSCSFCVVDIRRYDCPVVYCSPSFTKLTGYSENEVVGKNCRFLQSPDGIVHKGDVRRFTAHQAVAHLKKSVVADKECQTSIVNYKKNGVAFINLVTVIPITGGVSNAPHEQDDIVYHVGFQVDLTDAPNAILQKLRDGSYIVNYSSNNLIPPSVGMIRDRKNQSATPVISKQLKALLLDSTFAQSIPIHSSTTVNPPCSASSSANGDGVKDTLTENGNSALNLILLEKSPDFVHVVSLKGSFLYVAPSVRHVLGYEPEALVGKSIAEFCHPADVVPLMRELKESSATPGAGPASSSSSSNALHNNEPGASSSSGGYAHHHHLHSSPKTVDLLFRAKAKSGRFVWIECRGRLHVEPGKGRKAIILTGRARGMPCTTSTTPSPLDSSPSMSTIPTSASRPRNSNLQPGILTWAHVASAGGLTLPIRTPVLSPDGGRDYDDVRREFWGMFSRRGVFLVVGSGVGDVLGWSVGDVVGRELRALLVSGDVQETSSASPSNSSPSSSASASTSQHPLATLSPPSVALVEREIYALSLGERDEFVKVMGVMRRKDNVCINVEMVLYPSGNEPSTCPGGMKEEGDARRVGEMEQPVVFQIRLVDPSAGSSGSGPSMSSLSLGLGLGPSTTMASSSPTVGSTSAVAAGGTTGNKLAHAPNVSIFEELDTRRGSSWQYELQQLKYANQRLVEEIEVLSGGGSGSPGPVMINGGGPSLGPLSSLVNTTSNPLPLSGPGSGLFPISVGMPVSVDLPGGGSGVVVGGPGGLHRRVSVSAAAAAVGALTPPTTNAGASSSSLAGGNGESGGWGGQGPGKQGGGQAQPYPILSSLKRSWQTSMDEGA